MYLYNDNKNKIDIYKFEPIEDMIMEYRVQEMTKLPREERIYKAVTNSTGFPLERNNLLNVDRLSIEEINYPEGRKKFNRFYHKIEKYTNFNDYGYYNTLTDYYTSGCTYGRLIEVVYGDSIKNFLLPSAHYLRCRDEYQMESIINIPEKLKVLHYLETGNFDCIADSNIDEQASLFTLSNEPILSILKEELKLLKDSRLVRELAPNSEIKNDTNMIKRLKKIYK